jgi:ubiquinone/menaquinone biosynthesis C-methylase UbiE
MSLLPASVASDAFDNPVRGRFNAWFFGAFDRYINHIARPLKEAAFGDLGSGRVLEIGPGVGANLAHLPPGAELIAVEPNLRMHDRLRTRSEAAGVELTLLPASADRIPLPDGSVDEVICSLVLCTVDDPAAVLAEVRRVLRPGGRFRFVEHVASPVPGPRAWSQRLLRRPWGWVFEGCDPHRHTAQLLDDVGFSQVDLEHHRLRRSVFFPVNTAIAGTARR